MGLFVKFCLIGWSTFLIPIIIKSFRTSPTLAKHEDQISFFEKGYDIISRIGFWIGIISLGLILILMILTAFTAEIVDKIKEFQYLRDRYGRKRSFWTTLRLYFHLGRMKSEYLNDRKSSAEALGRIGDIAAVDILGEIALSDREASVRISAVKALGELKYTEYWGEVIAAKLKKTLNDNDVSVRNEAIQLLKRIDNRQFKEN